MKPIVIMLVIVAIIWALNSYTCMFIGNSSEELLSSIEEVKQAVQANNTGDTTGKISRLRNEWESAESRWEVLVDHKEVDRIDTLVTHLEGMAQAGSLETMMPELEELSFFVSHIDDKHKIKLENVF